MPFWDEVVAEVVADAEGVKLDKMLVDALAARVVLQPRSLDVIVASNLFGDILSDLAAAVAGSIGSPRAEISTRPGTIRRCSNRCTGPHRTSPAKGVAEPGRPDVGGRHDARAPR